MCCYPSPVSCQSRRSKVAVVSEHGPGCWSLMRRDSRPSRDILAFVRWHACLCVDLPVHVWGPCMCVRVCVCARVLVCVYFFMSPEGHFHAEEFSPRTPRFCLQQGSDHIFPDQISPVSVWKCHSGGLYSPERVTTSGHFCRSVARDSLVLRCHGNVVSTKGHWKNDWGPCQALKFPCRPASRTVLCVFQGHVKGC